MKTVIKSILAFVVLLMVNACSSTQSLQEYYVDNSDNPNFISFDIPTSILNIKDPGLSQTQKEAIESFKKLNILAFKKNADNAADYIVEKAKLKNVLKADKYTELMKFNTSFGKATIKYLGDEDAIDEVVVYADNKEKGFAIVRVLGNNMNPAHLVELINALEKSNYKGQGLDRLKKILE